MGIHNLAIVFPQFIVSVDRLRSRSRQIALVASVIFKLADGDDAVQPTGDPPQAGRTGVAWVLRFGGLMALVSGYAGQGGCRRGRWLMGRLAL